MNRRGFLKSVVDVSIGAIALPSVVKAKPKGLTKADIQKVRDYFERNEYKEKWLTREEWSQKAFDYGRTEDLEEYERIYADVASYLLPKERTEND